MKSTATPFLSFFTAIFHTAFRCITALSVLMLVGVSQQALKAVGPMDPAFGAPAAFPAGNMPSTESIGGMPLPEGVSEADFNAMVSQIQEQLEKMSPEEIEKLQKEAEEMLINSGVSREEIEAFKQGPAGAYPPEGPAAQPMVTPPASLAAQPAAPILPAPQIMPLAKAELPSLISESEVAGVLKKLIRHATALREQIALTDALRSLRSWSTSLNDIIFYVKVIDSKAELRKRLTTKEFAPFFEQLQRFATALDDQQAQLQSTTEPMSEEENPYDTLRISQNASNKEIKKAAKELLAEKDPEALKKRLTEEGADPLDIKRQVQSARIARAQIKEAYEKLTPPENRKQTDRQLKALREQQKSSEQALKTAATELNRLFSQRATAIIRSAEEFLKKYEPAELARKKEMDAAEAKQRKEQEARAQLKPSPAPYLPAEFYPPAFEGPRPFDAGRPSPFIPSSLGGERGGGAGAPGSSAKPESKGGRGEDSKKGEGKREEDKKKDEEDKKKESKGKSKDKKEEKKRGPEKELAQLSLNEWFYKVNQFGKALDEFERNLGIENIPVLTTAFDNLGKAKSNEDAEKTKQTITKIIGSQSKLLEGLLATWEELERFDDVAKLTPEEKKKFTEHYEKLKKYHVESIKLFTAIANRFAAEQAAAAAQKKQTDEAETTQTSDAKKKGGSARQMQTAPAHPAPAQAAAKKQEAAQEQEAPKEQEQEEQASQEEQLQQKQFEAELKYEAHRGAKQLNAEIKRLIADINAVNPENEEDEGDVNKRVVDEILKFHDPEAQEELTERIQPALDQMHQRLVSYTPLRNRWDTLLKRARADENDAGVPAAVEQLQKETEAIGYHNAAQARSEEILKPRWHSAKTTVSQWAHTVADWFRDLWQVVISKQVTS